MHFSAFPLLCTSYLHLILRYFAPLVSIFLSTLILFPLLCSFSVVSLFFCSSAFLFKLALKQFYDTISTKQINSLVTILHSSSPPLQASNGSSRAFSLMRTAFIIRPVAHRQRPKQKHQEYDK